MAICKHGTGVTPTMVNVGKNKKEVALKAEARMLEFRTTASKAAGDLDGNKLTRLRGEHDIDSFFYAQNASKKFKSINGASVFHFDELRRLLGELGAAAPTNPYLPKQASAVVGTGGSSSQGMVEIKNGGAIDSKALFAEMTRRGIEEEAIILDNKGSEYCVSSIDRKEGTCSIYKISDKRRKVTIEFQQAVDSYKVKKTRTVR